MSKLTVALCTYNRAKYLAESIKGIINQTYKDFTFLILDNASEDETKSVVESFNDDRIKYLYFDDNVGMAGNWLRAVELCETEYLSIAHDDDIWLPTLLERELEIMEADKDIVLISCRSQFINECGEEIDSGFNSPFTEDKKMNKLEYFQMAADYNGAFFMSAPAAMFRTNILDKIDYEFFKYTGSVADTYWYLKLNELGSLYLIGDALLHYRTHKGQYSADKVFARKEHRDYILPLLSKYVQKEKFEAVSQAYENDIKINEFAHTLTEKFEKKYVGYYFTKKYFADRDLMARIMFLNHRARGNEVRYVIWGCGSAGLQNKEVFDILLPNYVLVGFIDKFKKGECMGYPIFSPDEYNYDNGDYIIISTSTGGFDVMSFLEDKGLLIERDFMVGNVARL